MPCATSGGAMLLIMMVTGGTVIFIAWHRAKKWLNFKGGIAFLDSPIGQELE
jgi:hypothetical protein